MYVPPDFRVEDPAELQRLMRAYNFATLVSQHDGAPFASHLPLLLDPDQGPHGALLGHMARANPQWRDLARGQEVLVIFQGPHAYISPAWYEATVAVPTWNYAVVHAYGTARLIEDRAELRALLRALVTRQEAAFAPPWAMDLPEGYLQQMMRAIVGFALTITRIEGKYKLSQNRPLPDQQSAAAALERQADPLSRETAAWMRRTRPEA